eukprot:gnl/TRDRNA2_/TRDRNA2_193674_c0_seq1.p1 gnl/TRDRNA2_/TRDRNA2_193674_c0~~gnl/TRDRNA2_/TRDRNA2_193674_c0_seq1.p1  ORF type:complete len:525 (+),score=103.35 gnl/TRDRNA2_/TRDRNA2_193674_c0_seq1:50-1624(+)
MARCFDGCFAGVSHTTPKAGPTSLGLGEKDAIDEGSCEFVRSISFTPACHTESNLNCRLVDCGNVSPTSETPLDAPRLEFPVFRRRAECLVNEFFRALDIPGMVTSIKELGSPCFHDELVSLVLRSSMDKNASQNEATVALLAALADEEPSLLSSPQLVRGFEKLVVNWDDLCLDVPNAPHRLVAFLSAEAGLLDKGLFARLPEGLLRKLLADLSGQFANTMQAHVDELAAFKAQLNKHIEADLFGKHSVTAFAGWLRAEDKAAFHHEVVVAAGSSCFVQVKGQPAEKRRALVLRMLAHLHSTDEDWLLDEVALQLGFSRLLGMLREPDGHPASAGNTMAKEQLVGLLRGVVEQQLLPAEFLRSVRRMRFGGLPGVEVLREAQRQTPMFSRRAWGSGDARQFRMEVREAILEYFDSGSAEDLGHVVSELHLSRAEQAQFIRKILVTGMEKKRHEDALYAVAELVDLSWSMLEVQEAFEQLRDVATDLVLDLPHCREQTSELVQAAVKSGLLEKSYVAYHRMDIV